MKEPQKYKRITLVFEPTIALLAEMKILESGVLAMRDWLQAYRPECLPETSDGALHGLLPHDGTENGRKLSDNEMLVELAGRKCYNSFGLKAGRKSNGEYIQNTQSGDVPHASIMYHAKATFFFAGVSRRVSHEMIRNYVGSDRSEEGSPSQESTRYTHHPGHFVVHPYMAADPERLQDWAESMNQAYVNYLQFIEQEFEAYNRNYKSEPIGMNRKRIYESASQYLPHSCETSWIWTTNPIALAKFIKERAHPDADAEVNRFAEKWHGSVVNEYPNLFQQPWMKR